jgi:PAS domain S-box-containing protein
VTTSGPGGDLRSLKALVDDLDAVVWEADATTGRFTFVSGAAGRILGFPPRAFIDEPDLWADHLHPDDRDVVLREFLAETAGPGEHDLEYRFCRGDGAIVWLRGVGHAIVDEHGRPRAVRGLMFDVTRHAAAEERPEPVRARGSSLLAAAAHDLRTPLAAILGLALTLERHPLEADDARDLAERIAVSARTLDRMITNLLDLERISRGGLEPQLAAVDLGALVARMVGDSDVLGAHRVSVDTEEVVVEVDLAKAERIVGGLLENAARRTPPDAPIRVRVRAESGGALIDVEDHGPDVPADERRAILGPLTGSSEADRSHGARIAIALVAALAELHGGRISVHGLEGGGTSFRVWLPVRSMAGLPE